MNSILTQGRYLLSLAEPILDGLDDSHRALEPQPGAKTAGWLIGHLAVSGDFARRLYGRPPLCPVDWRAAFNPGSQPSREPNDYPSMATLRDTFERVYSDLCAAASEAAPPRSEEHTSELQSPCNLVCRLLLEKKNTS